MALAGIAFAALSLIPLIVVALVPSFRQSLVAWAAACGLTALAFVELALQIRVVLGPGEWDGVSLIAGIAFSAVPLPLLLCRMFERRLSNVLLAALPVLGASAFAISGLSFRERSERLLLAAEKGDSATVARLIEEGADPDCFEVGYCAIDSAIESQDWRMVEILIDGGARDAEYKEDEDNDDPPTSAAKRLDAMGKHDLARRLRSNVR